MGEKHYTPDEIAQMYNVTRNAVYNWYHRGQLEAIHLGRALRIPESALQDFIRRGGKATAQEGKSPTIDGSDES